MQPSPAPLPPLSAAVLAGGRSTRMGRDKALLTLGGVALVARAARILAHLSDDVMVVADDPARYAALTNARPVADGGAGGEGPLVGIVAALAAARHERVLIVATDLPFLSDALLAALAAALEADAVAPLSSRGLEPLVARYHRRTLPALRKALAAGERSLMAALARLDVTVIPPERVTRLDPSGHTFLNANNPSDWELIQHLFKSSGCVSNELGMEMGWLTMRKLKTCATIPRELRSASFQLAREARPCQPCTTGPLPCPN